jgi:hypothetical protein
MPSMTSEHSGTAGHPTSTTVRTPHVDALAAALHARDHTYRVIAPDVIEVRDIAPDDLGWLAAAAGVVVYEMVTHRND